MNTQFSCDILLKTPLRMYAGSMDFGYKDYDDNEIKVMEAVSSDGILALKESTIIEPIMMEMTTTSSSSSMIYDKEENNNHDESESDAEYSVEELLDACGCVLDDAYFETEQTRIFEHDGSQQERQQPFRSLEPTPIGPNGVTKVVNELPIGNAPWLQTVKEFDSQSPLLLDRVITTDKQVQQQEMTEESKVEEKKQQQQQPSTTNTNSNSSSSSLEDFNKSTRWNQRYDDLLEFYNKFNHCLVPLHWIPNPSLAHWVKRQRYQYGLKNDNKRSNLTKEREDALNKLGFVWDSHAAVWEERWNELLQFKELYGHANISTKSNNNPKLAIWVKCQRRQYKLLQSGKKSSMTKERIEKLQQFGFQFDRRLNRANFR